ncbi:MAG: lipoprotein-releasing system transmembrane subunit LolC [SAR116 cluster bacterium]|nr:lipoprotein-releasing system transmembrane subunit LolC [SAR116 cluster bacterium]RPH00553.1 MAG: lipoprotein-releasing ABC transporter permease subunit [Candidatus Puniceispirillum sp. TMED176]
MLFSPVERLLAMRYMRARRAEGFISVIAWFSLAGITLGVATLIIVMSVMNGFRAELIGRILGLNGHVGIYAAENLGIENFDDLSLTLAEIPGVIAVTPQVEGQVMVTRAKVNIGAVIRGVRWSDLAARRPLWEALDKPTIAAFRDGEGVLIGKGMAFKTGAAVGATITLTAARGEATAFGTLPKRRTFRVAGIFDVGMHEYDNSFVFMPLDMAGDFLGMKGRASGLEIYTVDPQNIANIRVLVADRLTGDLRAFDWLQRNRTFINALRVERNVMFLILTLIILVAAFNIISSMIMLVRSKHADIAVLRTMGAGAGSIIRVFLMTGASIGIIGTLAGTVLGLLFCWKIGSIQGFIESISGAELFAAEIYFLSTLPALVNPTEVGLVIAMALALSFLASLYPAWRAGRIAPAEVLRNE